MSQQKAGKWYLCLAAVNILLALPECLYAVLETESIEKSTMSTIYTLVSNGNLLASVLVLADAKGLAEFDPLEKLKNSFNEKNNRVNQIFPLVNALTAMAAALLAMKMYSGSEELFAWSLLVESAACIFMIHIAKKYAGKKAQSEKYGF